MFFSLIFDLKVFTVEFFHFLDEVYHLVLFVLFVSVDVILAVARLVNGRGAVWPLTPSPQKAV